MDAAIYFLELNNTDACVSLISCVFVVTYVVESEYLGCHYNLIYTSYDLNPYV